MKIILNEKELEEFIKEYIPDYLNESFLVEKVEIKGYPEREFVIWVKEENGDDDEPEECDWNLLNNNA